LVALIHNPRWKCGGFDQFQIDALPIWEQALANAEHKWIHMQNVFIHQIVLYQSVYQDAAAIQNNIFAGLTLQVTYSSTTLPLMRLEFRHPSADFKVLETTYFFIPSNGSSAGLGSNASPWPYQVFRPSSNVSASANI